MKIRSQVGMVLNLDKCIGCHTCSVTCKNVWTSREGMEYAWFNNVESKPGVGFPNDWENQEKWKGGWIRKINGKLQPRMGNRAMLLGKIFANPHLRASMITTSRLIMTTRICITRRRANISRSPVRAR
ncbi:respiratory nitrate reductase subunit beta [Klebsiella pneumoniae]|uniref:Respiratory nitrate reductase subunit beta n=1 Tax=Klebsiella pneumoniae TaxID=573 RepID=A0A2X1QBC1_KLEPN|nr:respiratory nitrate reductase subunit beta [Klebsiella pneumoniae]